MKKAKLLKSLIKWHKWPSLFFALLFILYALSGIVLNHKKIFGDLKVSRSYMPSTYKLENWNSNSVSGFTHRRDGSYLICGTAGLVAADSLFARFEPLDRWGKKQISAIHENEKSLYGGTTEGELLRFDTLRQDWSVITAGYDVIHNIISCRDTLYFSTPSALYFMPEDDPFKIYPIELPQEPEGYTGETGFFFLFWKIHSGEIFGLAGRIFVDLMGVVLIVLTVTGIAWFIRPFHIRRRTRRGREIRKVQATYGKHLFWHNKLGVWLLLPLVVIAFTGMFLRPPLLIAIARKKINEKAINPEVRHNIWAGKINKLAYHPERDEFLLGSSIGIYTSKQLSKGVLSRPLKQPVVSIMGLNVLEPYRTGYLVGSFSGLFRWDPQSGELINHVTDQVYVPVPMRGVGSEMAVNYLNLQGNEYYFDYRKGVVPIRTSEAFPEMPPVLRNAPMSLVHVALEVHTMRIFQPIFGRYATFLIPLSGLFLIVILITGFWTWRIAFRRKKS